MNIRDTFAAALRVTHLVYPYTIAADEEVMGGTPRIHSTRIAVSTVVGAVLESLDDIVIGRVIARFPSLGRREIEAALLFAEEVCEQSIQDGEQGEDHG